MDNIHRKWIFSQNTDNHHKIWIYTQNADNIHETWIFPQNVDISAIISTTRMKERNLSHNLPLHLYSKFVGATNIPMAPQIPSITTSMHRDPHTTRCGKLEDTDRRSVSNQLSPRKPQNPEAKPTFQ